MRVVARIHATPLITRYRTTSCVSTSGSLSRMPWSIACCTTRSPATGAAAPAIATIDSRTTRRVCPRRYRESRERPTRCLRALCGKDFLPEEAREGAIARQQLVRLAVLEDHTVVEHDRAVGDLDGREALRRDQNGPPGERGAQILDQVALRLRVDGRHRIVEDDDACARDQRPRERDALALAAREVDAALADQRVVAVGKLGRELRDTGGLARRDDLLPRRVRTCGGQVVAERDREQDRP